jgi:hypothetical protein
MQTKMQTLVPMVIEQTTRGFERAYDLLARRSMIMWQIW